MLALEPRKMTSLDDEQVGYLLGGERGRQDVLPSTLFLLLPLGCCRLEVHHAASNMEEADERVAIYHVVGVASQLVAPGDQIPTRNPLADTIVSRAE